VVFTAGIGFFAGAYQVFAVSLTLPIIKIVYQARLLGGSTDDNDELDVGLRVAILAGSVIGMLVFGFLADVYGRRKLYGWELAILLLAAAGVAMSSGGEARSMDIFGWLFAWRFVMGLGFGADYPLSATLTAEFAPTQHRHRMMAWVFYTQALGYLFAVLITLAVLKGSYGKISTIDSDVTGKFEGCGDVCIGALDRAWRIIIAVGILIGLVAVILRRIVPESPLYTADVLNRPDEAREDFSDLIEADESPNFSGMGPQTPTNAEGKRLSDVGISPMSSYRPREGSANTGPTTTQEYYAPDPLGIQQSPISLKGSTQRKPVASAVSSSSIPPNIPIPPPPPQPEPRPPPPHLTLPPSGIPAPPPHPTRANITREQEREAQSFWFRSKAYWSSFNQYFFVDGNIRTLAAVSGAWFLFDVPYYAMNGAGATSVATRIFYTHPRWSNSMASSPNGELDAPPLLDIFQSVLRPQWQILILVNLGSLVGGLIMIYLVRKRSLRIMQLLSFVVLFILFIITGAVLFCLADNQSSFMPAGIILYMIVTGAFEVGANFTTFMIPVELFPTRHRAFAHGVAAASGKLGAFLFQFPFTFAGYRYQENWYDAHTVGTRWLGAIILSYSPFMLVGALVTLLWIPETREGGNRNGQILRLDQTADLVNRWWTKRQRGNDPNSRVSSDPEQPRRGGGLFGRLRRRRTESSGRASNDIPLQEQQRSPLMPPDSNPTAGSSHSKLESNL
jgi:PHS family inorganic phosphate transporter-like MFS transporter